MSHVLFRNAMFCNARAWAWLLEVDEAEARRCREKGCRLCGGALHSASYPRKPYGLDPSLWGDGPRRFSFCCYRCRHRAMPPSARFFGRRYYVGGLFLLVSALALRGGVRLETVSRKWRVPLATLKRWRRWWREDFATTRPWRERRGDLVMDPGEEPLLAVLRRLLGDGFAERLLRALLWFMPWTVSGTFAAGLAIPAESVAVTVA